MYTYICDSYDHVCTFVSNLHLPAIPSRMISSPSSKGWCPQSGHKASFVTHMADIRGETSSELHCPHPGLYRPCHCTDEGLPDSSGKLVGCCAEKAMAYI